MPVIFVFAAGLVLAVCYIQYRYRSYEQRYEHIPGPRGLPFLGNILQLKMSNLHKTLADWAKVYGPVYKIKIMGRYTVVFNGYQAVHECLADGGSSSAGRPPNFILKYHFKNAGFARLYPDQAWKIVRRVFHLFAKPFGDGVTKLESTVATESKDLFETFDKAARDGTEFDPSELTHDAALKVIGSIVCGQQLHGGDPLFRNFQEYDNYIWEILGKKSVDFAILDILPFLVHFPLRSSKLLREGRALQTKVLNELKLRALSRDPEETLMGKLYQHKDSLPEDDVLVPTMGVVFSGRKTSGVSFACLLHLMAHQPHIQDRIAEELRNVTPDPDEWVSLKLREDLPYTRATLLESQRYQSAVPLTSPRSIVYNPITVRGMTIPEHSEVICNFWSVHHEEAFWGDPENFRPERFLDDEGNLLFPDHDKRRHLMSFGAGVRNCPGEQLAASRLFLWLANTCKKFRILPGTGNTPDLVKVESFRNDFVMVPPKSKIVLQRR